jgi:hypothetical protein
VRESRYVVKNGLNVGAGKDGDGNPVEKRFEVGDDFDESLVSDEKLAELVKDGHLELKASEAPGLPLEGERY